MESGAAVGCNDDVCRVGSHDAAMAAVGCGGESVAAVNCGDGAVTVVGCGCPVFPIGVVMLAPWQLTVAMQQ